MKTSTGLRDGRATGRWYALGGLAGIILSFLIPVARDLRPLLVTVVVFVFGVFKWTYEASTVRAQQAGIGTADEPTRRASLLFFAEVALSGLLALGVVGSGLVGIGFTHASESAQNQAVLALLGFLLMAIGVLAWAVNRWAFRKRSAYLIPAIVPIAAILALLVVRYIVAT